MPGHPADARVLRRTPADAGIAHRDRFTYARELYQAELGATQRLRHDHAKETGVAHLFDERGWEAAVSLDVSGGSLDVGS
jgi:hypothetical protein